MKIYACRLNCVLFLVKVCWLWTRCSLSRHVDLTWTRCAWYNRLTPGAGSHTNGSMLLWCRLVDTLTAQRPATARQTPTNGQSFVLAAERGFYLFL